METVDPISEGPQAFANDKSLRPCEEILLFSEEDSWTEAHMVYDPLRHHRRSLRMRGYDYSAEGAYFVTICTHDRECTFSEVRDSRRNLSEIGQIVDEHWIAVPNEVPNVGIDKYRIMSNHFHGIVVLWDKSADVVDECPERT